jgi:hypothetical protein
LFVSSIFALPELHPKQGKFCSSLAEQLLITARSRHQASIPSSFKNYFDILSDTMVEEDSSILASQSRADPNDNSTHTQKEHTVTYTKPSSFSWKMDSTINDISSGIIPHISSQNTSETSNGERMANPPITYEQPKDTFHTTPKINQCVRFNLIRHRGTLSDIPTLKLIKSFTQTLCNADPSIIFLPFQASKQHYSSISTLKQISLIDEQKMTQFLKSYHQRQHYSLSGFFHISSSRTLQEIYALLTVDE